MPLGGRAGGDGDRHWLSDERLGGEMEATGATVDRRELEAKVKDMYRHVATEPQGEHHFELGRALARRLGYPEDVLERIPGGASESFAGVGYFFGLADLAAGGRVIDLGRGSGVEGVCDARGG